MPREVLEFISKHAVKNQERKERKVVFKKKPSSGPTHPQENGPAGNPEPLNIMKWFLEYLCGLGVMTGTI